MSAHSTGAQAGVPFPPSRHHHLRTTHTHTHPLGDLLPPRTLRMMCVPRLSLQFSNPVAPTHPAHDARAVVRVKDRKVGREVVCAGELQDVGPV